jgi:hypothetical protein
MSIENVETKGIETKGIEIKGIETKGIEIKGIETKSILIRVLHLIPHLFRYLSKKYVHSNRISKLNLLVLLGLYLHVLLNLILVIKYFKVYPVDPITGEISSVCLLTFIRIAYNLIVFSACSLLCSIIAYKTNTFPWTLLILFVSSIPWSTELVMVIIPFIFTTRVSINTWYIPETDETNAFCCEYITKNITYAGYYIYAKIIIFLLVSGISALIIIIYKIYSWIGICCDVPDYIFMLFEFIHHEKKSNATHSVEELSQPDLSILVR